MSDDLPRSTHRVDVCHDGLVTGRLTIRRFRPDAAEAFAAYRSGPEGARLQGWVTPFSLEQARRFNAELAGTHPDTPGAWLPVRGRRPAGGSVGGQAVCRRANVARQAPRS
jgi:RimJ/RimL family protein N-acetyltransferase